MQLKSFECQCHHLCFVQLWFGEAVVDVKGTETGCQSILPSYNLTLCHVLIYMSARLYILIMCELVWLLSGWILSVKRILSISSDRQLRSVSDSVWVNLSVGYPIRHISPLGHTLKVTLKNMCVCLWMHACRTNCRHDDNIPKPLFLSCQVSWSVHPWSGGGESLQKGGLVPRGRVHRHDQQHQPHGQDVQPVSATLLVCVGSRWSKNTSEMSLKEAFSGNH